MCEKCKTQNRASDGDSDLRVVVDRLAKKQEELADVLQRFMNGMAETSGPTRAATAEADRSTLVRALSRVTARIVGGHPTTGFPNCCLIGRRNPNGAIDWFCTGVLIHPSIVLTAGHCFIQTRQANVVALNASDQNQLQNAELINIRRMAVHPRYQQTHKLSDMSVAILRKAATTAPVPVASTAELNGATRVTLVGFGNDDIHSTRGFGVKREVEVDMVSIRRAAADDLDADEQKFGYESDLEFVAGGRGFDTCNGDSGGPVYISVGGATKVAGLTSRATDDAVNPCGDGGIYTRIDANFDFVRQIANDAGIQLP
jgi:secreted trypsin-like serine protease